MVKYNNQNPPLIPLSQRGKQGDLFHCLLHFFVFFLLLPSAFRLQPLYAQVLTGLDVLEKENFEILKGKKTGLLTNHSSVNRDGKNAVDAIFASGKVDLKIIFSPEHGFRGTEEGGKIIENSTDPATGLPIYSLYGKNKRPDAEILKSLDVLLFDIQDIGARFYTYLTSMGWAMEEAAKAGIEFIVLDRPNPVTGGILEGPVLEDDVKYFTAYFPVPVRHGFTPGEMALFHKDNLNLNLNLSVIKMEGWKRDMWFDQTGIVWTNPSPNIRSVNAEMLYPGIGCFEATNVSVGRGTDSPFMWFGAPWMNAKKIAKKLSKSGAGGVEFYYEERIPSKDMYAGRICKGVGMKITDRKNLRAFDVFVHAAYFLHKYNGEDFKIKPEEIRKMTGTDDFYKMLVDGAKPAEILEKFRENRKIFEEKRKEYLLY
ncbi:MAG: DUF1343 domain-containing protein [Elusimicrobia bacterium]|nr:DUF1343 domain-containing protein [Elusimicrobiota bacterium]